jgi:cyclopropane-fatty-acyl-phospholipid synthase
MNIVIKIILLLIVIYLLYCYFKPIILDYKIKQIFSSFKYGNFEVYDEDNNLYIKVINNKSKFINKIKFNNKQYILDQLWSKGETGLGETYMYGYWSCDDLLSFLLTLQLNRNNSNIPNFNIPSFSSKSYDIDKDNIVLHYDVGNDFYERMLTDDLMAYTCGFFVNDNTTLNEAQYNKVNMIIKKLNPEKNKKILDIGCGWGRIANYVSQKTNCKVYGNNISEEQTKYITDNYKNVEVIKKDYRLVQGEYDYMYSIGFFEHVRYENYDDFFRMVKKCLKPNGRLLLHCIVTNEINDPNKAIDTFLYKHIFPGAQISNHHWITQKIFDHGLNLIHYEYFGGQHYAKTLNLWRQNLYKNKNYILQKYSNKIFLQFEYYLSICEAIFLSGTMGICHFLITNDPVNSFNNSFTYLE